MDKKFYFRKEWRNLRELKLANNPLCQACERMGIVEPAEDVDHIIPRSKRPDLELDYDNLQCLCKRCHTTKTNKEDRVYENKDMKVKNLMFDIDKLISK